MMISLAAALAAAIASSPCHAAPVPGAASAELRDDSRARVPALAEELKSCDADAKGLLQSAAQLSGFDIWQRARAQRPGQPADADFINEARRFSYYFRDFSQRFQQLELKLNKLSERDLPKNTELLPPAERLARHAADLRAQANWLETQARDGAPDLRAAGFSAEASEFQQTALATAAFARRLDAHAVEILQKLR